MAQKVLLLFISLCCLSHSGIAQQYVDLLNAGYSQNATSHYRYSGHRFQHQGLWANVKAPIQLNENKDYLIGSLNYSAAFFEHSAYEGQLNLHDLGLDLGYLKNWNDSKLSTYFSFGGAIASDFSSLKKGAFNHNSTLLFIYKKRKGLSWRFGLNLRKEAFGIIISPLLGVNWTISPKLNLSFLSFSHLTLEYQFSNRLGGGLKMQNSAFSFTLADFQGTNNSVLHTYYGEFPFIPQRAFAFLDIYIAGPLVVFGRGGVEFLKELVHEEVDKEIITSSAYNGVVEPGFFFDIGFAWRIRL